MAAKREQILWKSVWNLSIPLERRYGLTALCSAGVLLLSEMTAEKREKAIERAAIYPHSPEDIIPSTEADVGERQQKRSRRSSKSA